MIILHDIQIKFIDFNDTTFSVFFSGVQFRTLDDKLWNSLDAVRTWKTSVPCLRSEELPNRKMSRWTDARDL